VLESLSIERVKIKHFRQATGAIVERWTGEARIHAAGTVTPDEVVFGEPEDLMILGSRTLEGLNLMVDPVSKRLVDSGPAPAAAAQAARRCKSGAIALTHSATAIARISLRSN
jgi:hypothetical protein